MSYLYRVRRTPEEPEVLVAADHATMDQVSYMGENGATETTQLTLFMGDEPVAQFTGDALAWWPVNIDDKEGQQ